MTTTYLSWNDRPAAIQKQIDDSFEGLSRDTNSGWGLYNGSPGYNLCGVDEYALMGRIIEEAPKEQKEFWALDIGAGNFQWGMGLADYLNKRSDLPKDIQVHIIGVRGETNLEERVVELDTCTLYQLGAFKIEELFEQFRARGFNVENKVDLVVSRWTFRHLVDPVGTFAQTYNLLRPKSGCFLFDGFFFLSEEQKECGSGGDMCFLIESVKADFLMRFWNEARCVNNFFLRRREEQPCHLPMSYIGLEKVESWRYQIGSACITRFKMEKLEANSNEKVTFRSNTNMVVGEKKIYEEFKQRDLFETKTLVWKPRKQSELLLATPALHQAVQEGSRAAVVQCLSEGSDINESDSNGSTALHIAIQNGNWELFSLLLEKKPLLTLCDGEDNAPLALAATVDKEGRYIKSLLAAGADPQKTERALSNALDEKNKVAAELFLAAGAKPYDTKQEEQIKELGVT